MRTRQGGNARKITRQPHRRECEEDSSARPITLCRLVIDPAHPRPLHSRFGRVACARRHRLRRTGLQSISPAASRLGALQRARAISAACALTLDLRPRAVRRQWADPGLTRWYYDTAGMIHFTGALRRHASPRCCRARLALPNSTRAPAPRSSRGRPSSGLEGISEPADALRVVDHLGMGGEC